MYTIVPLKNTKQHFLFFGDDKIIKSSFCNPKFSSHFSFLFNRDWLLNFCVCAFSLQNDIFKPLKPEGNFFMGSMQCILSHRSHKASPGGHRGRWFWSLIIQCTMGAHWSKGSWLDHKREMSDIQDAYARRKNVQMIPNR